MEDGNVDELVDPRLEGNFAPQEMNSMISCAAASIRHSAKRRPKMSQIVRALEGDSILVEETNPAPKKRGSIGNGSTTHDSTYDTVAYNADMMKFRNMVMSSQEFGTSSEYGATSEYGLNPSSSSSSNNSKEMGSLNSGQHKLKY
ncbi:hypothetical protein Leryth_018256 [Lithospermum erythrorhizon]|nr:hypothetical protein Leryth_018256 [Lithospermum erythrorhizon]